MRMFCRFAIWRAGGRAVRISPNRPSPVDELDGLVVGGGDDISVTLYQKDDQDSQIAPEVRIDLERDHLERTLVHEAAERQMPVLGICRGAQMINVAFGGTLHTDIHEVYDEAPRMHTALPRKRIEIEAGSKLDRLLNCGVCRVNALHHQSIATLGVDLKIVARDQWGIVQAIESAGAFLIGVQWHPEFLVFDRGQVALFRELVASAADRLNPAAPPTPGEGAA